MMATRASTIRVTMSRPRAALGDPVAVVAWLANVLGSQGVALQPGHVVLTGALHAAISMQPGDVFTAEFDRAGPVTIRIAT
jgi:2-keto-4-pentenoate hydratase